MFHACLMNYKYIIMCRTDRTYVEAVRKSYQDPLTLETIENDAVFYQQIEEKCGCSHSGSYLSSLSMLHPTRSVLCLRFHILRLHEKREGR